MLRQHGDTRGVVAVEPEPDQLDEEEGNSGGKKGKGQLWLDLPLMRRHEKCGMRGGAQSSREAGV